MRTVRIAGHLDEQHLSELRAACDASGGPLTLDLSELQSVDSAGIQWLQSCKGRGAAIVGASPYIQLLFERAIESPGNPSGELSQ
jgi:anti-anti-sigma regulatory factor